LLEIASLGHDVLRRIPWWHRHALHLQGVRHHGQSQQGEVPWDHADRAQFGNVVRRDAM